MNNKKRTGGSLTPDEQRIVKALLNREWVGQDIQNIINIGRRSTVNSGRITGVKQSDVEAASDEDVETFLYKKRTFDYETGLNLIDDERLVKAREAMCLAVYIFNTPHIRFKAEAFSVYANIAWTYLVHEHCERKGVPYSDREGRTLSLSQLIKKPEIVLSQGILKNLVALKDIRDEVEHRRTGHSDPKWYPIFQACCLNFDKIIVLWFGECLSLQKNLSFALQFAKLGIPQIDAIQSYGVPGHIDALDARLNRDITREDEEDVEYRMKVVYTLTSASKNEANVRFINPKSDVGQEINNILVKERLAHDVFIYTMKKVCDKVEAITGHRFSTTNHVQSYLKHGVRPRNKSPRPEKTDKRYCVYNPALKVYTYSQAWVDFLVSEILGK